MKISDVAGRFLFSLIVVSAISGRAAEVANLTVNTLSNPSGIDDSPAFGWQITDEVPSFSQVGYEIKIYSDAEYSNVVYSSGFVASDSSSNVRIADFSMSPATRYYWTVDVEGDKGDMATSDELAYFDTGVMGDWSGARWIRTGSVAYDDGVLTDRNIRQTIEFKMNVVSGNPGVTFSTEDERSCFLWQFRFDGDEVSLVRKYSQWSDFIDCGEVLLQGFSRDDFYGVEATIRIEIEGRTNSVATFVNDEKVDDYKMADKMIYPDRIGFCDRSQGASNEIVIDDISVTYTYSDGVSETILHENFDGGVSHHFLDVDIIKTGDDYKGNIKGDDTGYFIAQMESHQPVFYTDFNIDRKVSSARLFTSAIGTYEIFLNGERVGTRLPDGTMAYEELKPGWSDYRHMVQYLSHDVTDMFRDGDNMIGIEVCKGYALGDIAHNVYSTNGIWFSSVIAKLVIRYIDGTEDVIVTDGSWKLSLHGPVMDGDIYRGEYFDARYTYPWQEGYRFKPFAVRLNDVKANIVSFSGHPVRALSPLKPVNIIVYDEVSENNDFGKIVEKKSWDGPHSFVLEKGETAIFDFGQNLAGVPKFEVKGPRGAKLKIRVAEMLNDSGALSRNNDGPEGSVYRKNYRYDNVGVVNYTLSGDSVGEVYRPTTSYFGFRYCEVTASEDVMLDSFESIPLTSSYEKIGEITTDNQSVNKIFENTIWGQYSNVINVPVDCPSRNEKMGWTGDVNVFANTAVYNANLIETLRVWLRELRNGQREDGAYSDIAPYSINNGSIGHTAWADAGIFVPWVLYRMSGNFEIIRENYQSMKRFMDYTSTVGASGLKYPGLENAYGDWWGFADIDSRFMSQAHYAKMAELMAKMAKVLSECDGDSYDSDCDEYSALFSNITEEMQSLYFNEGGLNNPSQGACALAVMFNVCADEEQRKAVGQQLADLVVSNGYKLNTGFVCTPFLLPALTETGHDDVAYELLLQRACPSWLYMIDQGATTFWEHWDGYTPEKGFHTNRENSFNHYAYGAVVEWMYSHMSGIRPDEECPGFKKIIFMPFPDRRAESAVGSPVIKQAKATHRSPYGIISAEWRSENGELASYDISVPSNTEAEVHLPMQVEVGNIQINESSAIDSKGVDYMGTQNGRHIFKVLPGNYTFLRSNTSSSNETVLPEVSVYPNPVADFLYIETSEDVNGVSIYDLSGKMIGVWSGDSGRLDLSGISSGMYILRVELPDSCIVKKIIKR